jgi:hypothetical protein
MASVDIDTSWLIISTCHFPMAAIVAINVIGRQLVQLFHHTKTGGFLVLALTVKRGTLAVFLLYGVGFSYYFWKPGRVTHLTKKKKGKGEKQILIGQRVLKTGWWKLLAVFLRKGELGSN